MEQITSKEIWEQKTLQEAKEEAVEKICLLLNNQPSSVKGEREHNFNRHLEHTQGIEWLKRVIKIYEARIKKLNQHERN